MRVVPTLGWRFAGDPGEAARPAPLAAARGDRRDGIARRGGCRLRHFVSRRVGAAARLRANVRRSAGAARARSRREPLGAAARSGCTRRPPRARRLARMLPSLAIDLGPGAGRAERLPATAPAASPRVTTSRSRRWPTRCPTRPGSPSSLSVMGSLNALREFGEGRADIAGFHVPIGAHASWDRSPFLRWLRARRDKLIRFVDREQGLILAARQSGARAQSARRRRAQAALRQSPARLGNPAPDRPHARRRAYRASALEGFGNEEFTHPAVAATVASGGADAGFGLRAAAAEYGLAFVPLVRERYFLAVRAKDAVKPPLVRLIEALKSPAFARRVRRLPGYDLAAAGSITGVDVLAPAAKAPPSPASTAKSKCDAGSQDASTIIPSTSSFAAFGNAAT